MEEKFKRESKNIFLIGIGGSSMSALALILKSMGHNVSGSDIAESDFTNMLQKNGITVYFNTISKALVNSEIVCYSSATENNDINFNYAFLNKKCMISRSKMLHLISNCFERVLAVSGTHGKSTASAMLAFILDRKTKCVTAHIGAIMKNNNLNYLINPSDKYFVTEACEYKRSFLSLMPSATIILNIELDHTDYYKNLNDLKSAFFELSENTKELLIINGDDSNCKFLKENKKVVTFGLKKSNDCYADNIKWTHNGTSFSLHFKDKILHNVRIKLFGTHNVLNTLAVYLMCVKEGISDEEFLESVYLFEGINRRFEIVGKVNGANVIFDYAHHPSELEKVISMTRKMTENKLYVVFQPHTFSRTKSFLNEFVNCFLDVDEVVLMPIYSARETNIYNISSLDLLKKLEGRVKVSLKDNDIQIIEYFKNILEEGDNLLFLGAGDIYNLSKYFKIK